MTLAKAPFSRTLAERPDQWNRQFDHMAKGIPIAGPRKIAQARRELRRQESEALAEIQSMIIDAQEAEAIKSMSVLEDIINDTFPSQQDA